MTQPMHADEARRLLAELADLMIRARQFNRARTIVDGLLELKPDSPYPLVLQGNLEFARRDYRAAERSYRQGLTKDPSDELAKTFLAQSLLAQKRLREAEPILREVSANGTEEAAVAFAQKLTEGMRSGVLPEV